MEKERFVARLDNVGASLLIFSSKLAVDGSNATVILVGFIVFSPQQITYCSGFV
jgi:hypothetical protein